MGVEEGATILWSILINQFSHRKLLEGEAALFSDELFFNQNTKAPLDCSVASTLLFKSGAANNNTIA